jgi:hypothetical protein
MNRYTLIEKLERKQSRADEHWIMNQHFVAYRNTVKATRESKIKKIASWTSIFGAIIRVVIALFK